LSVTLIECDRCLHSIQHNIVQKQNVASLQQNVGNGI
jgi:hypothetical protein